MCVEQMQKNECRVFPFFGYKPDPETIRLKRNGKANIDVFCTCIVLRLFAFPEQIYSAFIQFFVCFPALSQPLSHTSLLLLPSDITF